MTPTIKRLVMVCSGTLLFACADIAYRAPSSDPVPNAEHAYQSGRSHHLAQRYSEARTAYEAALYAVPSHVNARNGLAVLHAENGELDKAIGHWNLLTEKADGVESAFLFSNLGYAYYLRGDYVQARAALENACLQDPLNYRAWRHLGNVLDKLGDTARAQAMHRQAAALQGHDLRSDLAQAPPSKVKAIAAAARPQDDDQRWAQTEVTQDASGMFVLRRVEAPASTAAKASVLLEISNGNGVRGMARTLARRIGAGEGRVVRLTNQKGYGVRVTRVEYSQAFKLAAERIAQRVGAVQLVQVNRVGRADIRVVLGRDQANPALQPQVAGTPLAKPSAS